MNRKKRNGKSFLSLLLAVIMTVSLLQMANQATAVHAEEASPEVVQEDAGTVSGQQEDIQEEVSADAAEPSQEETILTENTVTYVPDPGTLPDADELFAGYVEEQFYGDGSSPATGSGDGLSVRRSPSMSLFYSGVQAFANYGGSIFTGRALDVYQQLDQKIAEVAANGGDTRFTVTLADPLTGATREEAEQLLSTEVNLDTLFDSLLADNPYDLYWYDKTTGTGVSYNISIGQQATISQIIFEFYVAVEYQEGSNLAVSTSKATAAGNAARTAQGIAAQYVGRPSKAAFAPSGGARRPVDVCSAPTEAECRPFPSYGQSGCSCRPASAAIAFRIADTTFTTVLSSHPASHTNVRISLFVRSTPPNISLSIAICLVSIS